MLIIIADNVWVILLHCQLSSAGRHNLLKIQQFILSFSGVGGCAYPAKKLGMAGNPSREVGLMGSHCLTLEHLLWLFQRYLEKINH